MALIDVGSATQRQYGGVGFALSDPRVVVLARKSSSRNIAGLSDHYTANVHAMVLALEGLVGRPLPGDVCVKEIPDPHVGLGSKTAVLLSVGRALTALNGHSVSPDELWRTSGRGGTSGIGVNCFYRAGLIVDGGHPAPRRGRIPQPSSSGRPERVPPVLVRLPLPDSWRVTLVLPEGRRVFGGDERRVFAKARVTDLEVLRVLAAVYHGLVPAVESDDLEAAAQALRTIMSTGFKQLELQNQSQSVRALANVLAYETGMPVGMSSMGPLVYVLHRELDGTSEVIERCAADFRATMVCTTSPANSGHSLERLN